MFKFLTEFGPLLAFFWGYKTGDILDATLYMLVVSMASIVLTLIVEKRINNVNLISTILLLASASLTLFSGNAIFIKMKPTLLYCLFAISLLVTNYKWQPAMKYILGRNIKFEYEKSWKILNTRFMWFFLVMAIANEFVWRNFTENAWVNFKVFGILPITMFFVFTQIPFIIRHQKIEDVA